jgi:hypothetical protein
MYEDLIDALLVLPATALCLYLITVFSYGAFKTPEPIAEHNSALNDAKKTGAYRQTPEKFLRFTQIALEKKLAV